MSEALEGLEPWRRVIVRLHRWSVNTHHMYVSNTRDRLNTSSARMLRPAWLEAANVKWMFNASCTVAGAQAKNCRCADLSSAPSQRSGSVPGFSGASAHGRAARWRACARTPSQCALAPHGHHGTLALTPAQCDRRRWRSAARGAARTATGRPGPSVRPIGRTRAATAPRCAPAARPVPPR